jgi:hypothetical protein
MSPVPDGPGDEAGLIIAILAVIALVVLSFNAIG